MTTEIHNLDEGIVEYFEFILFGKRYKCRFINTEELAQLEELSKNEKAKTKEVLEYFYNLVSPVDENAPEFKQVAKKMTVGHIKKFMAMIVKEFNPQDETAS